MLAEIILPIYKKIKLPQKGHKIQIEGDRLLVPNDPIIPFLEGDGIGRDIWKTTREVIDSAVNKAYKGIKEIVWLEVYAGEKAIKTYGKNQYLPNETIQAIKEYSVAIKGPLTTPVGGGINSINVLLKQKLDLFASVLPVKFYSGSPSPVKRPQDLDVVIFSENTEDVHSGIEFKANTKSANEVIEFINSISKKNIVSGSGIGIKPISEFSTVRLVKKAIEYAIENKRSSVTLVHKGNIMKFTEGAFRDWGYKTAKKYFANEVVFEDELKVKYDGKLPEGKILINDRLADDMFQQLLLHPTDFDVIATSNLNGEFLSNACAAQVGGLGIVPRANYSYHYGLFEAGHGSAPKYAGMDKANPSSLILSGAMMLQYLGWSKASGLIEKAMRKTIKSKIVTFDFARKMKGAKEVSCSNFGKTLIKNL